MGVSDILADSRMKQMRRLVDQRDRAAQVGEAQVAQVAAVEAHHAGVGIIETQHEVGDRGFADAARAHDRADAAGGNVK
jgi:hypothetical protein